MKTLQISSKLSELVFIIFINLPKNKDVITHSKLANKLSHGYCSNKIRLCPKIVRSIAYLTIYNLPGLFPPHVFAYFKSFLNQKKMPENLHFVKTYSPTQEQFQLGTIHKQSRQFSSDASWLCKVSALFAVSAKLSLVSSNLNSKLFRLQCQT